MLNGFQNPGLVACPRLPLGFSEASIARLEKAA
jgi:hypothetical protein